MSIDLRLIAIADPAVLGGRDLVAAARAAQAGGASMLQLRMKAAPAATLYAVTVRLVAELQIPVLVNDRADVAWAAGAQGVHVGADDVPPAVLRALAPPPFSIGVSVGTPAEAAAIGGAAVDYWSLGPFYPTGSKSDAGAALGSTGFRRLTALVPRSMPVVAIGGITATNAGEVIAAGASGVAVISAIFAASDIEQATRAIRHAVDRALAMGPAPRV